VLFLKYKAFPFGFSFFEQVFFPSRAVLRSLPRTPLPAPSRRRFFDMAHLFSNNALFEVELLCFWLFSRSSSSTKVGIQFNIGACPSPN
jgi:hypothetical protein